MSLADEKKVTVERLRELARLAGLQPDDQSLELLAPQVERFFASIAKLDELPLGETQPAIIYTLKED